MNAATRHLRKDGRLAKIIDDVGMYEIRMRRNRFASLVDAIITQQLSGAVARRISARFRALYGGHFPKPADVAGTSTARLRRVGLSTAKARYIRGLAREIESGSLRFAGFPRLSDEEIIARLVRLDGIGEWTAQMFLIFTMGREDVLPTGDLGLQKGIRNICGMERLPTKAEMTEAALPWRPYRSIATWYLWQSLKTFDGI